MGNSDEVASAGGVDSTSRPLSEAQLAAFWNGLLVNFDAARRMARAFVSQQDVDDVVHSAAIRFKISLEEPKKRAAFPKTDDDFRRQFLAIVRNYATDCVRGPEVAEHTVHSHWGEAPEPAVGGRKNPDRALDRVFARNDEGEYDAPAPTQRRDLDELHRILRNHLDDLSQTQYDILFETFYEKRKRAEVAARHGISVSTYDNHLQAAFRALRESLKGVVDIAKDMEISPWYDLVEELLERRADAELRRARAKKGKRSNTEGERSNREGERGKSSRAGAA